MRYHKPRLLQYTHKQTILWLIIEICIRILNEFFISWKGLWNATCDCVLIVNMSISNYKIESIENAKEKYLYDKLIFIWNFTLILDKWLRKYCKTKGRLWNSSKNKQRQINGGQIFLSISPDLCRTKMVWNEGLSKFFHGNGRTGDKNAEALRTTRRLTEISFLHEIEFSLIYIFSLLQLRKRNDIHDIGGLNSGAQTSHMTRQRA